MPVKKKKVETKVGQKKALPAFEFGDDKIERLLSPKKKMDMQVEGLLSGLGDSFNLLVLSNKANHSIVINVLLRRFSQKSGASVVYVAVNKPAEKIKKELLADGLDLRDFKFIDMVSMELGAQKSAAQKDVSFISSTSGLNELIDEIQKSFKEKKGGSQMLLLDSVSTLLVYNDSGPVEKLIHALMGRLNKLNVSGVFLMAKSEEHEDIIQTISQFCDRVVEADNF